MRFPAAVANVMEFSVPPTCGNSFFLAIKEKKAVGVFQNAVDKTKPSDTSKLPSTTSKCTCLVKHLPHGASDYIKFSANKCPFLHVH